ncbi:MAG: Rieske 2Fe-2S domain-containing protein [Gemmatimonadaceae bacterium]|nr:Rieske 2Fe-2S domain-containing protein [Gemmatimonadaceae bacterium]
MSEHEDVAALADVGEGELLDVTLASGDSICLFKLDGRVGALGNVCTHAEFAMSDGVLHADGTIECVWHGARFDCRTGVVVRQPATDPLPVYEAVVRDGRVLVASRPAT